MQIVSDVANPGSTNYTTSVNWQTNQVPPSQYISLRNGPYLILSISLSHARREMWWDTSLMLPKNQSYMSNPKFSFKNSFGISLWDIGNSGIVYMLSKAGMSTNSVMCDNIRMQALHYSQNRMEKCEK